MSDETKPGFAERLIKSRKARGFKSPRDAAKFFGWPEATYYQHELGMRGIGRASAKYAQAFKVSESWLLTGEGEAPPSPKIPVRGYAAGSATGFNIIQEDPIDYFRCPPALEDVEGAYAVYVRGKSMEPQYREGDLCFVHPRRIPEPGDTIIIQQANGREPPIAFIKNLVRRSENTLIAAQHNPPAQISYPQKTLIGVHKVLSMREIYGV